MTWSTLGAENRVAVPQTVAICVGSTGVNEEVARARCLWQLPQAPCAFPGLKNQYLCPVAHSELLSVP